MERDKRAGKLDRAIRPHVYQMRRRAARKLLCKSIVAIELKIVLIEADTFVPLLQLGYKRRDAIEFLCPHFNVFRFPGCAHDVVDGLSVQEKVALFAVLCQRWKIVEVFKIDSRVDLDRV